jgi:hypothetical protein
VSTSESREAAIHESVRSWKIRNNPLPKTNQLPKKMLAKLIPTGLINRLDQQSYLLEILFL